ncbi:serine protease [Actinoplanes sp. NPDC051851]|uniref:serine protease n=1 Tax=Actinoplanes sp. NPDC051851 TaxID=3154753 RepID=UPI003426CC7D
MPAGESTPAIGEVRSPDGAASLGTAFAVSGTHLLTAAHMVAGDATVLIRFPGASTPRPARVLDTDERLDVAVLVVESLPEGLIPLVPAEHRDGQRWRSRGWSEDLHADAIDGAWIDGTVSGVTVEHGRPALQLRCEQSAAGTALSLHGFSGAPVLPAEGPPHRFLGLVRWNPESPRTPRIAIGGMVYACPAATVRSRFPAALPSTNPYPGLRALRADRGDLFVGRDTEVRRLAALVQRPGRRLTVVTGLSGSGKSSLVRAGLIDRLRADGPAAAWHVAVTDVYDETFPRLLGEAAEHDGTTLLVLDQFERFTLGDHAVETVTALETLIAGAPRVRTVLVIRTDFLAILEARFPGLHALAHDEIVFPGVYLDPDGIRGMIEEPARAAGLRLEPGLTDALLHDLTEAARDRRRGEPAGVIATALPMLAIVLHRLGEAAATSHEITISGYAAIDRFSGALTRWADVSYARVPPELRPRTDRLLLRLVRVGLTDAEPDTRAAVPLRELAGDDEDHAAYAELRSARLVLESGPDREPYAALVHDSLIHDWSHLSRLVNGARPALVWRTTRFDALVERWRADGEPLTDGETLATAQRWLAAQPLLFDADERRFIAESRHRRTLRRTVLPGAGTLVAAALAVLLVLLWSSGAKVDESRRSSLAERLFTRAQEEQATSPETAIRLMLQAYRQYPSDVTRLRLLGTAMHDTGRTLVPSLELGATFYHTVPAAQLDGVLYTSLDDNCTYLAPLVPGVAVDFGARPAEHRYCPPGTADQGVVLSRSQQYAATARGTGEITLWRGADPVWRHQVPRTGDEEVFSVGAVAEDGTVVAVRDGEALIGVPGDPSPQRIGVGYEDPEVAVGDDGATVLVTEIGEDGGVLLRRDAGGTYRRTTVPAALGDTPVLSPDGAWLYGVADLRHGWRMERYATATLRRAPLDPRIAMPESFLAPDVFALSPDGTMMVLYVSGGDYDRVDLDDPGHVLPVVGGSMSGTPDQVWINDAGDIAVEEDDYLEVIDAELATRVERRYRSPDFEVADEDREQPAPVLHDSGTALFLLDEDAFVAGPETGVRPLDVTTVLIATGPAPGDTFRIVGRDGEVRSVDAAGHSTPLTHLADAGTTDVAAVAADTVAYRAADDRTVVRSLTGGDAGQTLDTGGPATGLQLADDGRTLLAGTDTGIRAWRLTGAQWRPLPWQTARDDPAAEYRLSGDGRHVLSDSARMWNVETGEEQAFSGSGVTGAMLSRDASRIAVYATPENAVQSIRVLDGNGGSWLSSLEREWEEGTEVALSPDGRTLLLADAGHVTHFTLDPGAWAAALCATLGGHGAVPRDLYDTLSGGLDVDQERVCG